MDTSSITPPRTLIPFFNRRATLPASLTSKKLSMPSLMGQASKNASMIIPPNSPSDFSSPLRVSEDMEKFLHGQTHMSRNDVMKLVWGYINHNKLKAPYYKTFDITLDDKLTSLMGNRIEVRADDIKGLMLRHFPTKYLEAFPVPPQLKPLVGDMNYISIDIACASILLYIDLNNVKVIDGKVICNEYLSSILQGRTEVMHHEIQNLVCINFPMLYTAPLPVSQLLFDFCGNEHPYMSIDEATAAVYHHAKVNCLMGPSYKMVKVKFDDRLKELFGTEEAEFNEMPTLLAKHFII